jgi:hypothetical protein
MTRVFDSAHKGDNSSGGEDDEATCEKDLAR